MKHRRHHPDPRADRVDDHGDVHDHEGHEDRHQQRDRLLHSPQVQDDEKTEDDDLHRLLVVMQVQGEERKELVAGRGDGDGDRQDIVDQQGAAGNDADAVAEQLGGHEVPAAAAGEVLDEVGVGS